MKPVALIFDFDGVLVDSHQPHVSAWKKAHLELFQLELTHIDQIVGKSGQQIAQELSKKQGRQKDADIFYQRKSELVFNSSLEIPLLPGVEELLKDLQLKKIPFGIGSNARYKFILDLLERHGIDVPVTISFDHVERPKPHPEPFVMCAEALNIIPEDFPKVLVFDDSPIGILAAVDAGMTPIGVTTQISSEKLLAVGAVATCRDLQEVLDKGWHLKFN
ncbi:MAG: HAD family phosphatase [Oligoflexales bacterium]|nr:HAD family phosphatase [Oligoflexales bacterium]